MSQITKTLVEVTAGGAALHEPATRSEKKTPRQWQKDALTFLKDAPHVIIEAPTGSGKSVLAQALLVHKSTLDPKAKALVVVPQRGILEAFKPSVIEGVGSWTPTILDSGVKAKALRDWVGQTGGSLVCTHQALVRSWPEIRESLKRSRVTLWVDEAHHLEYLYDEEELAGFVNKMGKVVGEAMALGMDIGVSSATLFRGDQSMVINPSHRKIFKTYRLDFSDYIAGLEFIKDIRYRVETYVDSPMESVAPLLRSREKTIVYIPFPTARESAAWCSGDKHRQAAKVRGAMGATRTEGGLSAHSSGWRIVDLVSDEDLPLKEQVIAEGRLDAIVALKRFREGANWLEASRAVIIGRRQSLVELIQVLGRLLRDHPSKRGIEMVQLFPCPLAQGRRELTRRTEDYFHTLCGAILLRELLKPQHAALQKYGSETAAKALKSVGRALLSAKDKAPEVVAQVVREDLLKTIRTCQPDISQEEIEKLSEIAEMLVCSEIEKSARVTAGKSDGGSDAKIASDQEQVRLPSSLWAGTIPIKIAERISRMGRAMRGIRIVSRNLAGGFPKKFLAAVHKTTKGKLWGIRKLANQHGIQSLEEWRAWVPQNLRVGQKEADALRDPHLLPGWDSWETLMCQDLPCVTWEGNFDALVKTTKILENVASYGFITASSSDDILGLQKWLDRQRQALREGHPKVQALQNILCAKYEVANIGPLIERQRQGEAIRWGRNFGVDALDVHPVELLRSYERRVGVKCSAYKGISTPFVEHTQHLEFYWSRIHQSKADEGTPLEAAQRVMRAVSPRAYDGYLKFLQAVKKEQLLAA